MSLKQMQALDTASEVKQEPVRIMGFDCVCGRRMEVSAEQGVVPAPQRTWVGLTDEEIKALASWWPSYDQMPALMGLANDIQKSFKEKNT